MADLKLFLKACLCLIQFVILWRVLSREEFYWVPLQIFIAVVSAVF